MLQFGLTDNENEYEQDGEWMAFDSHEDIVES